MENQTRKIGMGNVKLKDNFTLKMPANPKYVIIVRLLASGIGRQLNLPEEEIEDLKLVLSEACKLRLAQNGHPFELDIDLSNEFIEIRIGSFSGSSITENNDEESKWGFDLLSSLIDKAEFVESEKNGESTLVLRKNLSSVPYSRI